MLANDIPDNFEFGSPMDCRLGNPLFRFIFSLSCDLDLPNWEPIKVSVSSLSW